MNVKINELLFVKALTRRCISNMAYVSGTHMLFLNCFYVSQWLTLNEFAEFVVERGNN